VGGEEVQCWIFPRRERGILVNSTVKTIMFWVFILVCLMLLWTVVQRGSSMGKAQEIGYSDLLDKIEAGQVQDATIQGTEVHGHLKGAKDEFHTTISTNNVDSLTKELRASKVTFNIKDRRTAF
jgi:cell division protease FtsH